MFTVLQFQLLLGLICINAYLDSLLCFVKYYCDMHRNVFIYYTSMTPIKNMNINYSY